ncbi:MAG TPA: methylated-DNA--[protein]-cysteine S-methyltransferase [Kiritimatiellia bacterium]|nr:methylated-DNA--[protein]-cysteine S-methyltransferase [Kiritimatiellia bacterium]
MNAPPTDLRTGVLETSWGDVVVSADSRGVWRCELPPAPVAASTPPVVRRVRRPTDSPALLDQALAFARAAIEGRDPGPAPAVHPAVVEQTSMFRRKVWRVLQRIPRGKTATYAGVARRAARPAAARAAGGACGANPVPLFIPCHRVTAANGRLGGFSSGLGWKRWLLSAEGAAVPAGIAARPGRSRR